MRDHGGQPPLRALRKGDIAKNLRVIQPVDLESTPEEALSQLATGGPERATILLARPFHSAVIGDS